MLGYLLVAMLLTGPVADCFFTMPGTIPYTVLGVIFSGYMVGAYYTMFVFPVWLNFTLYCGFLGFVYLVIRMTEPSVNMTTPPVLVMHGHDYGVAAAA